jgi:predicted HTH transcriptional regulator
VYSHAHLIAFAINKSDKTVQRFMDELKEIGVLERMGSRKTGTWKINNVD